MTSPTNLAAAPGGEAGAVAGQLSLLVEPFSHSDDPKMTGMRGVRLGAETGYPSGRVFATEFLGVWVAESDEVEIDGMGRVPGDVAAAWFRAVADYLSGGGSHD